MFLTEQLIDGVNRAAVPSELEWEHPERPIGPETPIWANNRTVAGKNMFGLVFESRPKGCATTEAKRRKLPIVMDVNGECWDIRETRQTSHGFDLYFGTLTNYQGVYRGGPSRIIATKELWAFWDANRMKRHGFLYDLPAGRTTLKRVRRRLGFNFRADTMEFWTDRIEDLDYLSVREFAGKHGVEVDMAFQWRRKMIGTRARPIGWWRTPKFLRILLSDLTLIAAGRKLGIGISHAKRLRDRAKLESTASLNSLPL